MTMPLFRFAVMGAGKIARKFCDAVALTEGCTVCAVASKSMDRAMALASEKDIPAAYDSYEQLLKQEKPDCVYISATCFACRSSPSGVLGHSFTCQSFRSTM